MIGRTCTLPTGALDTLTLAIASCSNYPFGHFNGYDAIARDEQVDFVLHLGDYLYEYGPDSYGGGTAHPWARSCAGQGNCDPRGLPPAPRPVQKRRRQPSNAWPYPLIAIWDDHESANPWMGARTTSLAPKASWGPRRESFAPGLLRMDALSRRLPGAADYWRHFRFGSLASLVTLETR